MKSKPFSTRWLGRAATISLAMLLSGCSSALLHPSGDVAIQQRNLILIATFLMLLIIVPVMVLTVLFALKYREDKEPDDYDPDWDHSTRLEFVIWTAPLLIIICLGAVTWTNTHRLDPYRPIERLQPGRQIDKGVEPLQVEVVSLDWKWLFIYPQYGIATVNDVAAPVDRPIVFHMTSQTVMNAFYIPALAGMIYTMPSMESQLHAVMNKAGDYDGFSSHYSGAGFSYMHFRFHGLDDAGFQKWVGLAKASQGDLTNARYIQLAKPSIDVPVMRFSGVAPDLYDKVLNRCVAPGNQCVSNTMDMDAATAIGERGKAIGEKMHGMDMTKPHADNQTASVHRLRGAGLAKPGQHDTRSMSASRGAPTNTESEL